MFAPWSSGRPIVVHAPDDLVTTSFLGVADSIAVADRLDDSTDHRRYVMTVERTPINPVSWSLNLGFDQGELIEGHRRQLVCSGQDAVDADGTPGHPGDMAAQIEMSLDNLEGVLHDAGMRLADIVRLNVYTTDFDELLKHWT